MLGRARRRSLLIDAGEQRNPPAIGIGGLLGHDGRPPADLYGIGRSELASYGVQIRSGEVTDIGWRSRRGLGPQPQWCRVWR